LERITSGTVIALKRKSRIDYLNGLLTFHVKDNAEDEELLRITENLITRIEVRDIIINNDNIWIN
jgi:hypothetical protein